MLCLLQSSSKMCITCLSMDCLDSASCACCRGARTCSVVSIDARADIAWALFTPISPSLYPVEGLEGAVYLEPMSAVRINESFRDLVLDLTSSAVAYRSIDHVESDVSLVEEQLEFTFLAKLCGDLY